MTLSQQVKILHYPHQWGKLNDEKVASSDVRTIKTLTQSEYDSISKDKKTLYIITDTGKIYLGSIPITGV